jgi:hypothetical protein
MRRQRITPIERTSSTGKNHYILTHEVNGIHQSIHIDTTADSVEDRNLQNWARIHEIVGELYNLNEQAFELLDEQNRRNGTGR